MKVDENCRGFSNVTMIVRAFWRLSNFVESRKGWRRSFLHTFVGCFDFILEYERTSTDFLPLSMNIWLATEGLKDSLKVLLQLENYVYIPSPRSVFPASGLLMCWSLGRSLRGVWLLPSKLDFYRSPHSYCPREKRCGRPENLNFPCGWELKLAVCALITV